MNKLKKNLLSLAIGEFAALCTFIIVYRLFNFGTASFIAFSYLIFILLQGSLYWFYRYLLVIKKERPNIKVKNFLRFLRTVNLILLVTIIVVMPFIRISNKDLFFAIGLFLFGVIEYINYYWYRLSYGKTGFNIKKLISTGLKESSINKTIKNEQKSFQNNM